MSAARRAAAWAVLLVGLTATQGAAQGLALSCAEWSSDPSVKVTSTVVLERFGYLDISRALEISPVQGTIFREGVTVKVVKLEAGPDVEANFVRVAIDLKRFAVYRLPRTAFLVDSMTGERLEFAEFRFVSEPAPVTEMGGLDDTLVCTEVPHEIALQPAHRLKDGDPRRDPRPTPRWDDSSLADLGREEDGSVVAAPLPGPDLPDLAGIGRRDASEPATKADPPSLGDLATTPGAGTPPAAEREPGAVRPEPKPAPVAAAAANGICDIAGAKPFATAEGLVAGQLVTAGLRSATAEVPLFTYSGVVDQAVPAGRTGTLQSAARLLEPVQIVRTFQSVEGPLILLRPTLPGSLAIKGEAATATLDASPVLTVRVFGDARMVALSGLDAVDGGLSAAFAAGPVQVIWHQVAADGSLGAAQVFADFSVLVTVASMSPALDVAYSDAGVLQRFADAMVNTLTGSTATTDLAIWVMEGVLLPDETPVILSEAIAAVGREGNVRRFGAGDGEPRRWLHILTGQFAQTFSESYIRGPVVRATPSIGEVEVERNSGADRRRVMEDPGKVILTLTNHFTRNAAGLGLVPGAAKAADEAFFVQGADGYDRVGIVVPAADQPSWRDTATRALSAITRLRSGRAPEDGGAVSLDLSALLLISSDADGVPNGLSGAAGALPQRLSRLRDGNLLDAYEALLRRLLADLEQARSLPASECGHLFFELTAP